MISRRKFLGAGTIAAVGAAVGSVAAMRDAYAKGTSGMHDPSREFFEKLTGTTFQARQDALRSVPLRLAEVSGPAGRLKALPGHDLFTLTFLGPADAALEQQTYRMEHPEAGDVAIFIVPVERRPDAIVYEAVFHTRVPGA